MLSLFELCQIKAVLLVQTIADAPYLTHSVTREEIFELSAVNPGSWNTAVVDT